MDGIIGKCNAYVLIFIENHEISFCLISSVTVLMLIDPQRFLAELHLRHPVST